MQTPSEYRKQAEDLVVKAQTALPEKRVRLLQMAQSFIRLAEEADLLKSFEGKQSHSKTS